MKKFQWYLVNTLEELKALGQIKDVRNQIQIDLEDKILIKARSWQELWEIINALQQLSDLRSTQIQKEESDSLYFKSEAARLIYNLLELDIENREKITDNLKDLQTHKKSIINLMTQSIYAEIMGANSLDKLNQWRDSIANTIHPEKSNHPHANLALGKLNILHKQLSEKIKIYLNANKTLNNVI